MIPCLPTEPNTVLSIARVLATPAETPVRRGDVSTGIGATREPLASGKWSVAPGRIHLGGGRP